MKQSHWKIRNLRNRHAHYVTIRQGCGKALDQVKDYMVQRDIRPGECRIIETGSRFINQSFYEFCMNELRKQGV